MKKILLCLFLLTFYTSFAQTLLTTHPLDMKRSADNHEILAVSDSAYSQLAIFAADKESLTALRFNGAVFFTDSLTTQRPTREYAHMIGYTFDGKRPGVYWSDENLKKIQGVYFDFETKTVARLLFDMPYEKDEEVVTTFSGNNSFYIVTLHPTKDVLKFYIFNAGSYEVKTTDFASYPFVTATGKKTTLNQLLTIYPLQKVETTAFNDLLSCSAKMKFYVLPNEILLTLDHNPAFTQLFSISTDTYATVGRSIPQPAFTDDADANSCYLDGTLYHLKMNTDEIALSAVSLKPPARELNAYHATNEEAIAFKNSPLLSQTGNYLFSEFKDTKRFLRKAGQSGAAISVYRTPDDILVTAGGVRTIMPAGDVILGAGLLLAGGSADMLGGGDLQTNYFEALFDDNFEHRPYALEALALDHIGRFTTGNRTVSLQTVIPFKGYYLLGYYDAKAKRYVLRKFEDNFGY